MDDSASSVNSSEASSIPPSSRGGIFSFMQRTSNPIHSTPNFSARAMLDRRSRNPSDIRRIMATAKAIADDNSHPNQDEVRTYFQSSLSHLITPFRSRN